MVIWLFGNCDDWRSLVLIIAMLMLIWMPVLELAINDNPISRERLNAASVTLTQTVINRQILTVAGGMEERTAWRIKAEWVVGSRRWEVLVLVQVVVGKSCMVCVARPTMKEENASASSGVSVMCYTSVMLIGCRTALCAQMMHKTLRGS